MGQKSNSKILRLGINDNDWESKYLDKTSEESSLLVYQDIEIRNYIYRFLNLHGLLLYKCNIIRTDTSLKIFISYFTLLKSISKITNINNKLKIDFDTNENLLPISSNNHNNSFRDVNLLIKKYLWSRKKFSKKKTYLSKIFIFKMFSSITKFLNNNYRIEIIFQNLNKSLSTRLNNFDSLEFRKIVIQLRPYFKASFFKEFINILLIISKNKSSSVILTRFIAYELSNMKKHNYFLTFLKRSFLILIKSKLCNIKGIKLKIKGRFNGAPRSKTRVLQIGKIPLQTLSASISYNCSTSYTPNGTFGVQIWIF